MNNIDIQRKKTFPFSTYFKIRFNQQKHTKVYGKTTESDTRKSTRKSIHGWICTHTHIMNLCFVTTTLSVDTVCHLFFIINYYFFVSFLLHFFFLLRLQMCVNCCMCRPSETGFSLTNRYRQIYTHLYICILVFFSFFSFLLTIWIHQHQKKWFYVYY